VTDTGNALRTAIAFCLSIILVQVPLLMPAVAAGAGDTGAAGMRNVALQAEVEERVSAPIVATGLPVPRWVTIKALRVNVRRGPSMDQDILWVYVKPGTPVLITAEYDTWRRIRDIDGKSGWVKAAMLDSRRNVVVTGVDNTALLSAPQVDAPAVAYAQPGLVASLIGCSGTWCEISSRGYDGYVARDRLWGVADHRPSK
jgi:SH3-like domain-containing protein